MPRREFASQQKIQDYAERVGDVYCGKARRASPNGNGCFRRMNMRLWMYARRGREEGDAVPEATLRPSRK
jgi:hypothetical protein